jgi:two-component system CitB family sensor kinase
MLRTRASARASVRPRLSLSQQVFLLSVVIVVIVVSLGAVVAVVAADRLIHRGAEKRVLSVAETVATMPEVAAALGTSDPSAILQPLAERLRKEADVSFVVIMTTDGFRFSHPNPDKIGGRFDGTIAPATEGDVVVETFEGSLGRSVRAVVPIKRMEDGLPIGLVSVGVTVNHVDNELSHVLPLLIGGTLLALAIAAAGSWWISRRVARQTFGLGTDELARLYAHHDAVLHGVREGLVVVGADRRIVLINDAATLLLGVDADVQGQRVDDLPLTGPLAELLASGGTVEDEVHLAGERLLVVSQVPVGAPPSAPGSPKFGTVLTLRDHSELKDLADELTATRSLTEALRASVHESNNRLHTIVMLAQLGDVDEAVRLATGEVRATRMLTSRLSSQFEEAALVALLLGKAAEAGQRGVDLTVIDDSRLPADLVQPVDLVTIVGNLVDNAIDAALDGPEPRKVEVSITPVDGQTVVEVRDSGPGLSDEALAHVFEPGWSTKAAGPERRHGRGIGLALLHQVVTRLGGSVEIRNGCPDIDGELRGAVASVRLPQPVSHTVGSSGN